MAIVTNVRIVKEMASAFQHNWNYLLRKLKWCRHVAYVKSLPSRSSMKPNNFSHYYYCIESGECIKSDLVNTDGIFCTNGISILPLIATQRNSLLLYWLRFEQWYVDFSGFYTFSPDWNVHTACQVIISALASPPFGRIKVHWGFCFGWHASQTLCAWFADRLDLIALQMTRTFDAAWLPSSWRRTPASCFASIKLSIGIFRRAKWTLRVQMHYAKLHNK